MELLEGGSEGSEPQTRAMKAAMSRLLLAAETAVVGYHDRIDFVADESASLPERDSDSRGSRMFALKAAISLLLLIGAIAVVGYRYGFDKIVADVLHVPAAVMAVAGFGLLTNAMLAVFRFKLLALDAGHPVGIRRAMAAVGAGSLAGALFFQLVGQLMARGVVLRRSGVPFGAVVVITLYERIVAAVVSGLIAVVGAVYIFGSIYIDRSLGGGQLIKMVCGLVAAVVMAGWLGYGVLLRCHVLPLLRRHLLLRVLRIAALTVLVQLPMMGIYVAIAHEFAPSVPAINLVAASAIVMFAASVPISLSGWGVRELSAVVALGTVGVPSSAALATAIIVGAGSLLVMVAIFAVSFETRAQGRLAETAAAHRNIDYAEALGWILPLMAAVLVLFQIYVPLGSGLINVNLGDPVVLLGGALFVRRAVGGRRWPVWRVDGLNSFLLLATAALGLGLLIGVSRFGWSDWALFNRFLGWFVLLAYVATGGLITWIGNLRALRIFALTAVGAALGIILIDLALVLAYVVSGRNGGLIEPNAISGFAQNRNAFAFQLLMALTGALVFLESRSARRLTFAMFFVALWLAGSRSGWISLGLVLAAAVYFRRATLSELATSLLLSAAFLAVLILIPHLSFSAGGSSTWTAAFPALLPEQSSSAERIESLVHGWALFVSHPIFGAGLGAFNHLDIPSASGVPLVIHSTELWLLAELGVVGFLIFVIPGLRILTNQWRLAASDSAAAIVTLCFIGFAVMSGPADMLYQRTFWLMVGAALGIPRLAADRRETILSSNGKSRAEG